MKCDWPNAAGFNIGKFSTYFQFKNKIFSSEKVSSRKFMKSFWLMRQEF